MVNIILIFVAVIFTLELVFEAYAFYTLINSQAGPANSINKRNRINFTARFFAFGTPPLLGLLVDRGLNYQYFISLRIFGLLMAMVVNTVFYLLILVNEKKSIYHFSIKKSEVILILPLFGAQLLAPFILNGIASYNSQYSTFMVQLSPIVNATLVFYIIFFLERRLAKYADEKKWQSLRELIQDIFFIRIAGRILAITIIAIGVNIQ